MEFNLTLFQGTLDNLLVNELDVKRLQWLTTIWVLRKLDGQAYYITHSVNHDPSNDKRQVPGMKNL